MISDELKQYVDDQIKETLKSKTPMGLPLDSDLIGRLDEVEVRLEATIQSLAKILPEKDWKGTLSTFYRAIKKKRGQDVGAGIDDFLARIDRSLL
jgi:hypothetical protein